ncbi:prepilin peptidase [Microbacterium sediminis]|nr:prepilin peptidase [Microbacterium sediminis]
MQALVAAAYLAFGVASLVLIRSDLAEHRLPNAVVLPATAVVGALLTLASIAAGDTAAVGRAAAGALALGAFYAALWAIGRGRGMGGGDVKLALLVGLFLGWHGWPELALGGAAAFVVGGASALALIAARRATARTHIAFGPFMLIGACLGPILV